MRRKRDSEFLVEEVYPNPLSGIGRLRFANPKQGEIEIGIYDIVGRRVQSMPTRSYDPGFHLVELDLSWHAAGNYFLILSTAGASFSRRVAVVK